MCQDNISRGPVAQRRVSGAAGAAAAAALLPSAAAQPGTASGEGALLFSLNSSRTHWAWAPRSSGVGKSNKELLFYS